MYYFDSKFLQQYMDQGVKLKVYANNEWYNISDMYDIHNPSEAVVYDVNGESSLIDYRNIEQIQVGNQRLDLEGLQSMMVGQKPEGEDKKKSEPKEPAGDEEPMPEEEPEGEGKPPKEKGPDLSWYSPHYELGRNLLKEAQRRKRNANSR